MLLVCVIGLRHQAWIDLTITLSAPSINKMEYPKQARHSCNFQRRAISGHLVSPPTLRSTDNLHYYIPLLFFCAVALRPNACYGLLILDVSRSHTTTHHSREDSSGWVISSSQRPLPDNTQHPQQTNIHAPCGIRNHDLSRRAAADLRLKPRGYWDRPHIPLLP